MPRCVASRYGDTRISLRCSGSISSPLFTIHQPISPCNHKQAAGWLVGRSFNEERNGWASRGSADAAGRGHLPTWVPPKAKRAASRG